MGKILIIPDVHWREFWKEPLLDIDSFDKVVFLGDYLDGYKHEGTNKETGFNNFMDIIKLKAENKDKIVLLLGNHDLHYLNSGLRASRYDVFYANRNREVFTEELGLFDMVWETEINGIRYFFSHAGVTKGWMNQHKDVFTETDKLPSADFFNNLLHCNNEYQRERFFYTLSDVSYLRWGDSKWGSMVWADCDEHRPYIDYDDVEHSNYFEGTFQIFGHSQQVSNPLIEEHYACLDVRRAFVLDENGKIEDWKKE